MVITRLLNHAHGPWLYIKYGFMLDEEDDEKANHTTAKYNNFTNLIRASVNIVLVANPISPVTVETARK